jgi:hypothetical protein
MHFFNSAKALIEQQYQAAFFGESDRHSNPSLTKIKGTHQSQGEAFKNHMRSHIQN